jgi:predicted PurR-regulated permease PerM
MNEPEHASATFRKGILFALGAAVVVLLLYGLYLVRNVLLILTLAGFWAYFLAWPAQALRRWMSAKAAIRVVFYTSFLVILGMLGPIGGMLYVQTSDLISRFDSITATLEKSAANFNLEIMPGQTFQLEESVNNALEQLRQNAPALLNKAFNASQSFLSSTAEVLVALIIIPVVALYLLMDSERLRRNFVDIFPPRLRGSLDQVLTSVNRSLGSYIYSRVVLALFAGGAMMISLLILGVPFSLVLGLLAFISEFIPVVGAMVALVPILLITLATKPLWVLLAVIAAFGLIQVIQSYVVMPRLMSETMDIHPLTVVVAMLVGGSIGGFAGLLLAIPAAAAIKVIFNVFVLQRTEKGVHVPSLDLIASNNSPGGMEYRVEPSAKATAAPPSSTIDSKAKPHSMPPSSSKPASQTKPVGKRR